MKKRTIVIALLAASIFNLILFGCLYDPDDISFHDPYGDFTGTASGSARGYKSDIRVYITLEKGLITKVNITHGDDREYADKTIKTAKELILATNSFMIDTISGATYTRNGIKNAGENALKDKGLIDLSIFKGEYENGDFTIKPAKASAGATITLTPKPKSGYQLKKFVLSPAGIITDTGKGTWTFTMPYFDVTVDAEFVPVYEIKKGSHTNGDFTISPLKAPVGATVTLTPSANSGYKFNSWVLYPADSATATPGDNGTWVFYMPDYDVTVNALFVLQ
jgi:major membrane immunogen (membrane-anchored lipoprotein)